MKPASGYLLGIGSNIDPENNIAEIIRQLLGHFPQLALSRILKIPPIGMNSHRDFLNLVVFIETDINEAALKTICNEIEVRLGRDRTDPSRKIKDRPADLDILTTAHFPDDYNRPTSNITDEYFLYPLLDELSAYLSGQEYVLEQAGITMTIDNLSFGQAATTINRNASTRHKGII